MTIEVTVVDYGSGNLFSVERALEHCGAVVKMAHSPAEIDTADLLILPGVGAFADGMQGLRERGFVEPIVRHARAGKPLLGICLGMQMLATRSTEFGTHAGLGLIEGEVVAIPSTTTSGERQKTPRIGWAALHRPAHCDDWAGTVMGAATPNEAMYLVHSFFFRPSDPSHVVSYYDHGGHEITAAVQKGNIAGVQFHPEKSSEAGLRLLANFLANGQR